jgi:hypothetical protein
MNHEDIDKILIIARKEVQQSRGVVLREVLTRRVHNIAIIDCDTAPSFNDINSIINSNWIDIENAMIEQKVRVATSDVDSIVNYLHMEKLIQEQRLSRKVSDEEETKQS